MARHEGEEEYGYLREIQDYCREHNLPDLSLLVVDDEDGMPTTWDTAGLGEYTYQKYKAALKKVMETDWTKIEGPWKARVN